MQVFVYSICTAVRGPPQLPELALVVNFLLHSKKSEVTIRNHEMSSASKLYIASPAQCVVVLHPLDLVLQLLDSTQDMHVLLL